MHKRVTDPYDGKTDEQVLDIAKAALRAAEALPLHSSGRTKQWKVFDSAMGEAMRRAMMQALWKLHEDDREPDDDQIASEVATIIELAEAQAAEERNE